MTCSLIPQFSREDVVAVRVKNVSREGDGFVFVSAYMALEEPAPPVILKLYQNKLYHKHRLHGTRFKTWEVVQF